MYSMVFPEGHDGKTVHAITVKDTGGWLLVDQCLQRQGFFEKTVSLDTQLII